MKPLDYPLFSDRVPEAAARQLAVVLAWLTECELATLERLRGMKSAAASDVRRHESICKDAVFHCYELHVPARGLMGRPCPRLAVEIAKLKGQHETA